MGKDIYSCTACSIGLCTAKMNAKTDPPNQCNYGDSHSVIPNWQKTTGDEITDKKLDKVFEPTKKRWYSQEEVDAIFGFDISASEPPAQEIGGYSKDVPKSDYPELSKAVYGDDSEPPAHDPKTGKSCEPESDEPLVDKEKEKAAKEVFAKTGIFPTQISAREFSKRRIEPTFKPDKILRPTPNCAICQWKSRQDGWKDLLGREQKGQPCCTAQGNRRLTSIYGNKICKRLFKPGTEPFLCTKCAMYHTERVCPHCDK